MAMILHQQRLDTKRAPPRYLPSAFLSNAMRHGVTGAQGERQEVMRLRSRRRRRARGNLRAAIEGKWGSVAACPNRRRRARCSRARRGLVGGFADGTASIVVILIGFDGGGFDHDRDVVVVVRQVVETFSVVVR